jgi:translocation and assembly module TamA
VRIEVVPGPLFRFGRVNFVDAQGGSPVPAPIAPEALGLDPGRPARSTAILAAEARLADAMRKEGRPFAEVAGRDVVADHSAGTVNVTFRLKRGPVAAFGEVTVEGTEKLDPGFVRRRSGFVSGERYDPERLAAFRKELTRHDVFDSVRIAEGDRLDEAGRVPIQVQVKERLRRFVGFGAKYSNTDRVEINGYWGHRNLFGGAERLRLEASATALSTNFERVTDPENLGFRLAAAFAKPGILTVRDDLLLDVSGFREVTDAYRRTGAQLNAGIRRRFDDRLWLQLGIDLEFTDVRDAFGDASYRLIGFPITLGYDSTDNALDPTRGWRVTALLEPFPGFGGNTTEMLVAKATASNYVALDERRRWVVAGRIAAGSLIGPSIEDVPAHRRFYVGGGGSLRGFAFQGVSPRDFAGRIIGGKSFLEGSLELRTRITDTIGAVAFVDAGAAYTTSFPNFDETTRFGAGFGLRYFTAIGPLRADIAFPLNRRKGGAYFGLYLSLGQAF